MTVARSCTHAHGNLMWGTDGVRVFTVDDGWGWIVHRNADRALERRVCRLACVQTRGPFRRFLQPISMGLARLYHSTSVRCGSGAGLANGSRLPVSVGSTSPTRSSSGGIQPSYAYRRTAPDQRRRREGASHGQGTRSSMAASIATSQSCGIAVRGFVKQFNASVDRAWREEKNRYLSPAQARLAWHATTSLRPAALRQTCLRPRNQVRYIAH